MYELDDPLKNWQPLEVVDIASARYALKMANDQHFAMIHMRQHMERELARSALEVKNQTIYLLTPYVDMFDSQGRPTPFFYGRIPNPLPSDVPEEVIAGIEHMQAQLLVERERAEAELADQCEPLQEIKEKLIERVKPYILEEFKKRPDWLGGNNSPTIGGCTMTYNGDDDVTFEFAELDYGD